MVKMMNTKPILDISGQAFIEIDLISKNIVYHIHNLLNNPSVEAKFKRWLFLSLYSTKGEASLEEFLEI